MQAPKKKKSQQRWSRVTGADGQPDHRIAGVIVYWLEISRKREDPFLAMWAYVAKQAVSDFLRIKFDRSRAANSDVCVWQNRLSAYRFLFRSGECAVDLEDLCQLYGPNVDLVRTIILGMAERREPFPHDWHLVGGGIGGEIQKTVDRSKELDYACDEGDSPMGKKAAPQNTGKAGSISGSRGGPYSISEGSGPKKPAKDGK